MQEETTRRIKEGTLYSGRRINSTRDRSKDREIHFILEKRRILAKGRVFI